MPIEESEGHEFPGSSTVIIPPVTAGECANTPALEGLVLHEEKEGRGATIRGGKAWATRTPAEIGGMCALNVPAPTLVEPASGASPLERVITGSGFGTQEWEVWASQLATWEAAVDKIAQAVVSWTPTSITVTADVECEGTGDWYFYVVNEAQLVNESGYVFDVTSCV